MIEPGIPLNPNRPQPQPLAQTLGQLISLRGMQQETDRRGLENQQLQEAATEQQQLKALFCEQARAEQFAATHHGVIIPLYSRP